VLLGASAFGKVAGFYLERTRVQELRSLAHGTGDPNGLKQSLGAARKTADTLKRSNLFFQTPPQEHPVKQVEGILGSEAFIAGKWYKTGDKIGGAKVVAVNATDVQIEWNGKETRFSPMASTSARPPGPPMAARGERREDGPQPPKPPEAKVVRPGPPQPAADDPLAWVGVKLSSKLQALLQEKWSHASPEERERGKQEWNQMSDEQKQRVVDAMEQRM